MWSTLNTRPVNGDDSCPAQLIQNGPSDEAPGRLIKSRRGETSATGASSLGSLMAPGFVAAPPGDGGKVAQMKSGPVLLFASIQCRQ